MYNLLTVETWEKACAKIAPFLQSQSSPRRSGQNKIKIAGERIPGERQDKKGIYPSTGDD